MKLPKELTLVRIERHSWQGVELEPAGGSTYGQVPSRGLTVFTSRRRALWARSLP